MGRPVVHWELWSKSPKKTCDFYAKVFDWKIQGYPEMNYNAVDTGVPGSVNGGIFTPPRPEPWAGNMSMYIDVDDLAAYRKRVVAAGGKILVEEQEVSGMGVFALFSDPDGRVMGLWKTTSAKPAKKKTK